MNVPVSFTRLARQDVRDARRYFNGKRAGLGESFVKEVRRTADAIAATPLAFAPVGQGVRFLTLGRFGYVVYYETDGTAVEIVAVVHGARPPEAWQDRLAP